MKELACIWMGKWHQGVKQMINPSWKAPVELGLGGHPPWGQAPGPQSSVHTVY